MQITTAYGDLDPVLVDAIAQEFVNHDRSPAWVKNVAQRWLTTESDVTAIAQDVADGTFEFRNIFESAPTPKGPTMPIRTLKEVTSSDIQEVRKAVQRVGTGPTQIAGLSRRFNIVESDMAALVTAVTTVPPKATTVTESGKSSFTETGASPRQLEAAELLLDRSNRAAADLSTASIQDLEAFAEMDIAQRAFGRR